MDDVLVSVIMSIYNETNAELESSISSILNQTYTNLEFVIINDNPENERLTTFLSGIVDNRVKVYNNNNNIGLVESLNKAISFTNGEYIARMDADDISKADRLQKQLKYIKEYDLDMIGADISIIDRFNATIVEHMHFPSRDDKIRKYIKYGNCLAHPTWFLKREVYENMRGYRKIKYCEDYDFILRVINTQKYKLGNTPDIGLEYRIRESGISQTYEAEQYVLRNYLSRHRKRINEFDEYTIQDYMNSSSFIEEVGKYRQYKRVKDEAKSDPNIFNLVRLLSNKYLYKLRIERYYNQRREKSY